MTFTTDSKHISHNEVQKMFDGLTSTCLTLSNTARPHQFATLHLWRRHVVTEEVLIEVKTEGPVSCDALTVLFTEEMYDECDRLQLCKVCRPADSWKAAFLLAMGTITSSHYPLITPLTPSGNSSSTYLMNAYRYIAECGQSIFSLAQIYFLLVVQYRRWYKALYIYSSKSNSLI